MNESTVLLRIEDLEVSIASKGETLKAINSVSMNIPRKSIIGIVGESGCGKSMIAMSVMGLLAPNISISGGKIVFGKDEISNFTPKERRNIVGDRLSIIFQETMTSLNPVVRVGKQVEEVLKIHTNLGKRERKERVVEMFRKVGIPDPEGRYRSYPFQLSGGLRQRIMIAMAMICNPDLLIADEPTTALDVTIEAQILQLMKGLRDDYGTSILMITHNLGIVSKVCDFVNVMYLGEIVEQTAANIILKEPLHPYTRGLIDSTPKIQSKKEPLKNITGMVPDLHDIPKGCRFSPRCEFAGKRCQIEKPELYEYKPGHHVRCFLYDNAGIH